MIDHVSLKVRSVAAALPFYEAALAPLGYTAIRKFGDMAAGLGAGGKPDLWLISSEEVVPTHVALAASRSVVDAFHRAALTAGGRDNGSPGVRPQYHQHYYGAFVYDGDGNNLEVVCHERAGAPVAAKAAPAKKAASKAPAKSAKAAGKAPAKKASAAKKAAAKKPARGPAKRSR